MIFLILWNSIKNYGWKLANRYINTPFNYAGNKFELLEQLLKLFPDNINIFYDVFVGSGSVFSNVKANKYIVNDIISPLIYFFAMLMVESRKEKYTISNHVKAVHSIYGLDKSEPNFRENYYLFRSHANKEFKNKADRILIGIYFYILLCTCNNNLIRFNKKMEFNQAFGNRVYNSNMENKLLNYIDFLKENEFYDKFRGFSQPFDVFLNNISRLSHDNNFIYVDPPYLITEAGYNVFWDENKEITLYKMLDSISDKVKWGVSNVISHKNKTNKILKSWASKYNIHYLDYNYNKVAKNKIGDTVEVFITNYSTEK